MEDCGLSGFANIENVEKIRDFVDCNSSKDIEDLIEVLINKSFSGINSENRKNTIEYFKLKGFLVILMYNIVPNEVILISFDTLSEAYDSNIIISILLLYLSDVTRVQEVYQILSNLYIFNYDLYKAIMDQKNIFLENIIIENMYSD